MRIPPEQLRQTLHSCELSQAIVGMALEQAQDTGWESTVAALMDIGKRAFVWKCCHLAAEIFDTYPNLVGRVEILLGQDPKFENVWFAEMKINNDFVNRGDLANSTEALISSLREIDGGKTIADILGRLTALVQERMGGGVADTRELMGSFESARQARERANSVSPQIDAWVKAHLLSQQWGRIDEQGKSKPKI